MTKFKRAILMLFNIAIVLSVLLLIITAYGVFVATPYNSTKEAAMKECVMSQPLQPGETWSLVIEESCDTPGARRRVQ